jgi:hypothetical protein
MVTVLRSWAFFAVAVFIGLSLFYLMQLMIKADAVLEKTDKSRSYLNFVRVKK